MPIRILRQGLPTVGLAKLGEKGKGNGERMAPPTKFDHIEITSRKRNTDGQLVLDVDTTLKLLDKEARTCGGVKAGCKRCGDLAVIHKEKRLEVGMPTRLAILLPYDDLELNFPHKLAWHRGRTEFCAGDGVTAQRRLVTGSKMVNGKKVEELGAFADHKGPCGGQCPDFKARRCKPKARLRFMLSAQQWFGGVYEYRTTSWNSIANIQNSLAEMQQFSGGSLRWVPLSFEVQPQTVTSQEGQVSTQMIAQVIYRGNPMKLMESVQKNLALQAPMITSIRQLEAQIDRAWKMTPEDVEDFRDEFDPHNKASEVDAVLAIEATAQSLQQTEETAAKAEPEPVDRDPALAGLPVATVQVETDDGGEQIPDAELERDDPEPEEQQTEAGKPNGAETATTGAPQLTRAGVEAAVQRRHDAELAHNPQLASVAFKRRLRDAIKAQFPALAEAGDEGLTAELLANAIEFAAEYRVDMEG